MTKDFDQKDNEPTNTEPTETLEPESLEAAAQDWKPDTAETGPETSSETSGDASSVSSDNTSAAAAAEKPSSDGPVTFVGDLYHFNLIQEVGEAQNADDILDLDLDEDLEIDEKLKAEDEDSDAIEAADTAPESHDASDAASDAVAEDAAEASEGVEPEAPSEPQAEPQELIAEAQSDESEEPAADLLEPEAPIEPPNEAQTEAMMESLEQALKQEHEAHARDLEAIVSQSEAANAEILAAQIAEDQALNQLMAEQKAEEDEADNELAQALPQLDEQGNLDLAELESCIEALLFMSDKPLSVHKLQQLLSPAKEDPEQPKKGEESEKQEEEQDQTEPREKAPSINFSLFQEAITGLKDRYSKVHHGIELVEVAGGYQFRTKPGRAALAKKLSKIQTHRLSSGAMETLAIVAYRQPVMKDDIDKIRGVDSSHFIRGLLDKRLIQISGRSELPGRPMLYTTTTEFLEVFGLKDLSALPPLKELEQMVPSSQGSRPEDEDPRIQEMRRLVSQMKSDNSRLAYDPREDEKILQELRTRVNQIPTTTPYIEQQKEAEKQAKLAEEQAALGIDPNQQAGPQDVSTQASAQAMAQEGSAAPEQVQLPPIPDAIQAPEPTSPEPVTTT